MELCVPCFSVRSIFCAIFMTHGRRNGLMDSRDEGLTLKNVDEQVEQYLARPQAVRPPTRTFLTHVVRDLQSIYEEERLEHVWAQLNTRVSVMNADNAGKQAG